VIISPLYAQIGFIVIAMLGLDLLVWAVTGTGWAETITNAIEEAENSYSTKLQ
jgi:late competence protein required for DNA uptake (superfamily II DNA/RNA helicase)